MSDDAGAGPVPLFELNQFVVDRFKKDIGDVTAEEADWRPLPQANNINVILRHLRIEAEWHLACLERGEPMPADASPELQQRLDDVPLDLEKNRSELFELLTRFVDLLRGMSHAAMKDRSALAYADWPRATPPHLLGFHQAVHLSGHWAQIRTIRTLYLKTRGESVPERYYPGNVSYPNRTKQEA